MARKATKEQQPDLAAAGAAATPPPAGAAAKPFGARQYLLMNAAFALFCIVQLVVVRVVLGDSQGLYFFFALMVAGFAAVSLFDYVYDRTAGAPPRQPES
jgi:hypothetical protein